MTEKDEGRRLTRQERQALMETLPGVIRLLLPMKCDGIKYGTVALKDLYSYGPQSNPLPPRGIQDKSRCKKQAWWQLKASRRRGNPWGRDAKSGTYCWTHLAQQVDGADVEHGQWIAALMRDHPDVWAQVKESEMEGEVHDG